MFYCLEMPRKESLLWEYNESFSFFTEKGFGRSNIFELPLHYWGIFYPHHVRAKQNGRNCSGPEENIHVLLFES